MTILLAGSAMNVMANELIEVFTIRYIPVRNISRHMRVCYIDDMQKIVASFNQAFEKLKNQKLAIKYINQNKGNLEKQARCISDVYEYGIEKIPAIVFDKKYVTYGISNVNNAISEKNAWEMNHA